MMNVNEKTPGKLVYIPIDRIHPHPDNPRKELGDLTELVESIKANGILQNLTVVPFGQDVYGGVWEDEYRVIIGHRRHAAAEKAGLTELPCIIADMTEEEQISTMLVENMQRSDLTVYEQAKSFQQLSLNFGKSIAEISTMSGFSEATVRRRQKLAELDDKKFKKAVERGATLFDFAELEKVTDPEAKEKCLEALGTANFKNVLKSALDEQKWLERREVWIGQLDAFATRIEQREYVDGEHTPMNYFMNYGSWSRAEDVTVPSDAGEVKYYYRVSDHQIDVYRDVIVDSEEERRKREQKERRDKQDAKVAELQDIARRHYELRSEFVKNFGGAKSNLDRIVRNAIDTLLAKSKATYYGNMYDYEELAHLLGIPYDKTERSVDRDAFRTQRDMHPERTLLIMVYAMMDGEDNDYIRKVWDSEIGYKAVWHDNQELDSVYYLLEELGYECSDEERQMRRGTHPLFDKEE